MLNFGAFVLQKITLNTSIISSLIIVLAMLSTNLFGEAHTAAVFTQESKALSDVGGSAKYKELILQADHLMQNREYDLAIKEYNNALVEKAGDSYALYKIKLCERYRDQDQNSNSEKSKLDRFYSLMDKGNALMNDRNFQAAIDTYIVAKQIEPEKNYVLVKLEQAKKGLTKQQDVEGVQKEKSKTQEEYDAMIKEADRLYYDGDWANSIGKYEEASRILEYQQYPMLQIKRAVDLIQEFQKKQEEKDRLAAYNKSIKEADDLLIGQRYAACIRKYQEADSYVKNQYRPRVKIMLAKDMIRKRAIDSVDYAYSTEIITADEYRAKDDFEKAIEFYNKALEVYPLKQYPITKIMQCEDLIVRREEKIVRDKFNEIMKDALDLVRAEKFIEAGEMYMKAKEIYPLNNHVNDMIRECKKEQEKIDKKNRKPVNYFELFKGDEQAAKGITEVSGGSDDMTRSAQAGKNFSFKELYLGETKKRTFFKAIDSLAVQYPPGVTQEIKTGFRKSVVRRVVIVENLGDEFLKVEHEWGGTYYFKNGEAVNRRVWELETGSP